MLLSNVHHSLYKRANFIIRKTTFPTLVFTTNNNSRLYSSNNNNHKQHTTTSTTVATIKKTNVTSTSKMNKQAVSTSSIEKDIALFKKPIQKNSDLLLRDISFIVKDSDANRTEATNSEQDRNNMLIYALRPVSLTDSQRRDVVLSEPYSYVTKRVIQPKQLNILKRWIQTNCFGYVFNTNELIDPHLVKCFVSRTMLKKRERNLVYEFNRSNLQLEMQGLSHLDYVITRYLHEFQSTLLMNSSDNTNNNINENRPNEEEEDTTQLLNNIYATEQITHLKSLMMQHDILSILANSMGLNDDLLAHFQDIPQQRTGVDILAALIAQTSNLLGMEKSRLFLNRFIIPELLQILDENPVPEIQIEDRVRQLSHETYKQDPVIQTREYKKKKSSSPVFNTLIIVSGMIKGQGISTKSIDESKTLALRNAYEQLSSETANLIK